MEKAFRLDCTNDRTGSLSVNCRGCFQTEPLRSFGPASKPHDLVHDVGSGKGVFRFHWERIPSGSGIRFFDTAR
jgi:hypothetical protein